MPAFQRHFKWPSKRDNYPVDYQTGAFITVGTIFFLVAVTLPSFEPCTCRFFNSENNNNNKNNNIKPHTETVKFSIKWQAGHKSFNTALFQFDLWMKYYGVTTQMKLLQQYFHMILFTCIKYVLPTFESG